MKQRGGPVFWRTLKLNLVIVIVITICLLFLSTSMRATLQFNEENTCKTTLEYGLAQLTAQIEAVNADIMAFKQTVTKQNAYGLQRYDAVELLSAKSALTSIMNNNVLVSDIALVYEDRDMVITTNSIYYSIDDFLQINTVDGMDNSRFYDYIGERWQNAMLSYLPCSSITNWDKAKIETAFCYAFPLDTERYTTRKGVAYVFLELEGLLEISINERILPYASFYLYDNRIGSDQEEPILVYQGQESSSSFEINLINETGTLRAEIRVSNAYLDEQMRDINQYIVWILLAAALAGIGTALWSSYRQYLPMKHAIRRLQDRGLLISRDRDEYAELMDSVETLLSEKESISRQLSGYQAQLHQNLLDRLFANTVLRYDVEQTLRMEIENFPEQSLVYCGRIFISSVDTNHSMEMTLVMVLEYLRKNLPPSAILHSTDTLTFGLIYPCEDSREAAEEPLRAVLAGIPKRFAARVVLTLGGYCEGMGQIGSCFERAQGTYLADGERSQPDALIIHPEDMDDQDQGLRLRGLQSMYQFMVAGDSQNAIDAMKSFYSCPSDMLLINLRERYLLIRAHIMMTAREVAPDQPCPEISLLRSGMTLDEQTASLAQGIIAVCSFVTERQTNAQGDRCSAYVDYLKQHYQDPELCASSLANEFRVSEKYLFGLFKKRTGYSPTSFLHHIRMEEAVRLLTECDDTVQDISVRVGFANFGTFYKAFKREYGVAPGRYREMYHTQGE